MSSDLPAQPLSIDQLSSAPVRAYFDRLSDSYHTRYRDSRLFRLRKQRFADMLRRYAGWSDSALDFGCGAGGLTPLLAEIATGVVAVDASSEMQAIARQRLAGVPNAKVVGLDELNERRFDLVLCSSVIEYVDGDADLVWRIAQLMRPGALLLVTLPNRFGILQNLARLLPGGTETCRLQRRLYCKTQAKALLSQYFEVVECAAVIGLPLASRCGLGELILCAARRRR